MAELAARLAQGCLHRVTEQIRSRHPEYEAITDRHRQKTPQSQRLPARRRQPLQNHRYCLLVLAAPVPSW